MLFFKKKKKVGEVEREDFYVFINFRFYIYYLILSGFYFNVKFLNFIL